MAENEHLENDMLESHKLDKPIDVFPKKTSLTPENGTTTDNPESEENKKEKGESIAPVKPESDEGNKEVIPEKPESKVETTQPAKPTEVKPNEPDYKKKFSDSTRRNQIVESQFKELQKILGDITKQEVPTDEEMVKLIPDWDYLSDREKNSERKMVVIERRQNHILNTIGNIANETESVDKLSQLIDNEPRLKGKEDEFYEFATRPNNRGASMEVLVNAFLFEATPITEDNPEEDKLTPDDTQPSLERGTGGGNMLPQKPIKKDGEMSPEELKLLRTQNPRKYNEMIRKGLIK